MDSHGAITLNSPAFWIAIIVTLFFIALLTYVYSSKNLKITASLTFLSAIVVGCAAGYDTWNYYLEQHFLAGIDQVGVPFRASRSGWLLLIDAWPLWLIPSLFLMIINSLLLWSIQKWFVKGSYSDSHHLEKPKRKVLGLTSEMVANQLELDTLKRALSVANQKLNQALNEKDREDAKNKELKLKLKQYERAESSAKSASEDELKALKIEVTTKDQQVQQLKLQINEQEDEINRLKSLIESLLNSN